MKENIWCDMEYNPYVEENDCQMFNFECDAAGWHPIYGKGSWGSQTHPLDYIQLVLESLQQHAAKH